MTHVPQLPRHSSGPRAAKAFVALFLAACTHRAPELPPPIPHVEGEPRTAFALRYIDLAPGTGALAEPRKCFYAHYTGWLTNGTKFDSSRDTTTGGTPRPPISFAQGARRVIAGWDAGFEGMRVGARRRLLIPYQLGYGELGRPPVIPPKSELIFDVELMAVADTLPRTEAAPSAQTPGPRCATWEEVSR
jgi:peptidylprolyl isomerase